MPSLRLAVAFAFLVVGSICNSVHSTAAASPRHFAPKQYTPWQPSSLSLQLPPSVGMIPRPESHHPDAHNTRLSLEVRGGGGIGSTITKVTDYIGETKIRCWTVLGIAILIEIASTTLLNVASNEKSTTKLALAMGMYMTSLLAFATSLPQIDVSIAYAVWSACGTALVSAVMILWFGEKADPVKIACILCIIMGVVGLNLRDFMM